MDEIIEKLDMIARVLETVETKGRQNLLNLGGAIAMIDEAVEKLKMAQDIHKSDDTITERESI